MATIPFIGVSIFSDDHLARNKEINRGRGLSLGAASCAVAVVGGATSVRSYIDELKSFDGEVWGINGTHKWLLGEGVDNTFFSIDPNAQVIRDYAKGAKKAILSCIVDPSVYEVCDKVYIAKIGKDDIVNSTTTASSAPMIAAARGHKHVTFYGCDGSYGSETHVNKNIKYNKIWVECGGKEYTTDPQMIMQTEAIAEMARKFPQYITVKGSGFLSALIEHGVYNVTHVSPEIDKAIKEASNG